MRITSTRTCSDAAADQRPWIKAAAGLTLHVRLTPRAVRDAIDGIERLSDGRLVLKARVRALPQEGDANAALIALLARVLDCPRASVRVTAGHAARLKAIAIVGDPDRLDAACASVFGPSEKDLER